jgi:hypothetical protein
MLILASVLLWRMLPQFATADGIGPGRIRFSERIVRMIPTNELETRNGGEPN